jgi:hypothetical protein
MEEEFLQFSPCLVNPFPLPSLSPYACHYGFERRLKFLASRRSQRVLISYFTPSTKTPPSAKHHAQHNAITPLPPKMQSLVSIA